MDITEVKSSLSERLGMPISLFDGESPEEDIAKAKALCAYKKEHEQSKPKNTREQFGEYMDAQMGIERSDESQMIIREIEESIQSGSESYPVIKDSGETNIGDTRPPQEHFKEWFSEVSAI